MVVVSNPQRSASVTRIEDFGLGFRLIGRHGECMRDWGVIGCEKVNGGSMVIVSGAAAVAGHDWVQGEVMANKDCKSGWKLLVCLRLVQGARAPEVHGSLGSLESGQHPHQQQRQRRCHHACWDVEVPVR